MQNSTFKNLCLILITSFFLACSPNKDKLKNITPEVTPQKDTNSTSQGMKVYIDPVTKEFLDSAPEEINSSNTKKINPNQNTITTTVKKPAFEIKESSQPGGGSYVKMPPP